MGNRKGMKYHKGYTRRNVVVVLDDINFHWKKSRLIDLAELWQDGRSFRDMGAFFKRDPDEVVIAFLDLSTKGTVYYEENQRMVKQQKGVGSSRVVTALEKVNFIWDGDELDKLAHMWNENSNLIDMSKYFHRNTLEIFLACFHLARQDVIHYRGFSEESILLKGRSYA